MVRHTIRTVSAGAALALTLFGCEQPQQQAAAPGALPRHSTEGSNSSISSTTLFAHGHLLERQGAFEQAVTQYERALEGRPTFIAARNRLGITLNKLARHADATREFEKLVTMQPGSAYVLNNLGFSYYLENRFDEAQQTLARALEIKPGFQRARMNYALALAKVGRFDASFEQFKQVCTPPDAYYNIGLLLTEAGRYAEAAQYLEGALELRPEFEAARGQLLEVARLAAVSPGAGAAPILTQREAPAAISIAPNEQPARLASAAPTAAEPPTIIQPTPVRAAPIQPAPVSAPLPVPAPAGDAGPQLLVPTTVSTPSRTAPASVPPAPTVPAPATPAVTPSVSTPAPATPSTGETPADPNAVAECTDRFDRLAQMLAADMNRVTAMGPAAAAPVTQGSVAVTSASPNPTVPVAMGSAAILTPTPVSVGTTSSVAPVPATVQASNVQPQHAPLPTPAPTESGNVKVLTPTPVTPERKDAPKAKDPAKP